MMQYLLAVHGDEEAWAQVTPEEMERQMAATGAFTDELKAAGRWVFVGGLKPTSTATVVSAERGDIVMTDGPYLETKEHLGGFWVITADDLDEALEWARQASVACGAPVEVRPFENEA